MERERPTQPDGRHNRKHFYLLSADVIIRHTIKASEIIGDKMKGKSRIITGLVLLAVFAAVLVMNIKNYDLEEQLSKVSPNIVYVTVEVTVTPEMPEESEEVEVTPTPEPTPDLSTPAGRAAAMGLPEPPDIDIDSWEYILANGDNSIAEYVPPELVVVGTNSQQFDTRIADSLKAMVADAEAQGLTCFVSSGYRSYSDQAANFTRVCQNNGVTDGKNSKGYFITMPAGCSEHQTGLAADITDKYYELKDESIENTALFQYMKDKCQEFGFIVRFPKDKEEVTGVMYEPFHFRYVGVEAATYIMENGICLEEFVSIYKDINERS